MSERFIVVQLEPDNREKRLFGNMTFSSAEADEALLELARMARPNRRFEKRPYRPDLAEATRQIREAAAAGRIEVAPDKVEAFNRIDLKNPDMTITGVKVSFWGPTANCLSGGFGIDWDTKSGGFGRCDFYLKDGRLHCENQAMGKEFILRLFERLVEQMTLEI